jgi:hypothetical protein
MERYVKHIIFVKRIFVPKISLWKIHLRLPVLSCKMVTNLAFLKIFSIYFQVSLGTMAFEFAHCTSFADLFVTVPPHQAITTHVWLKIFFYNKMVKVFLFMY